MRDDFSGENDIKLQKNAILRLQLIGCVCVSGGVYAVTGNVVALISVLSGGLAMTAILFLFASFAELLLEGVSIEEVRDGDDGGLSERQETKNERDSRPQEAGENEEEGLCLAEENSSTWNLTPKGVLAILLIPLKFLILLIPLFLFRAFGHLGLIYFIAGLLLSPLLMLLVLVRGRTE